MKSVRWLSGCWIVRCLLVGGIGCLPDVTAEEKPGARPIRVIRPRVLAGEDVPALRIPLGLPNDYKPWIVRLLNGDLLIVAFCFGGTPSNELPKGQPYRERAVFWRSKDDGRTWGPREERADIRGREFALTCLADGTLIMPCHFLANDAANRTGHTYSKIFRSVDEGKTWSELRVGPAQFPAKASTATDWNVVELPDPRRPGKTVVQLGVSMQNGGTAAAKHVFLWRSTDSGVTWDKSLIPDTDRWSDVDGFFSQSTTYRARSGVLLHPVRVDASGPHWKLPSTKSVEDRSGDQDDRTMLWKSTDDGKTWRRHKNDGRFGTYGEMYPRFLRLNDKRLLLTFTVRSNSMDKQPLGLRAIISLDDGQTWDFTQDRIVIADQNHGASGGGFGNTIQLPDGTLVSCYSYRGRDNKTHVEAVRWKLPPMPAEPTSFKHARVTAAWAAYQGKLTFGKGQTLALLDDGCNLSMPEWSQPAGGVPKVLAAYDSVDGDNDPKHEGRGYHGSTIGIPSSLNYQGKLGVAFNNQLAVVRALECCHCKVADSKTLAAGLQWVIDNHAKYRITTVNLAPVDDLEHAKPVATAIDAKLKRLRELGIWVSAPSGNHNFTRGISWPACQTDCFAIGAVKPGKDEIFLDRNTKIDLVVPAAATSSSNAIVCGSVMLLREAIVNTGYDWKKDGPNLPEAMMKILKRTGVAVHDPATRLTFRRLDLKAALDEVFRPAKR
ncbi:MAG: hypothetical protein FJ271_15395 [Planctomycetes bacterium]|nr:hypothetical protein [Planctomycetota bacterium]